jgi:hypothetical protein
VDCEVGRAVAMVVGETRLSLIRVLRGNFSILFADRMRTQRAITRRRSVVVINSR